MVHADKVEDCNLGEFGTGFEAVLVNPPWNFSDPGFPSFTFSDFVLSPARYDP